MNPPPIVIKFEKGHILLTQDDQTITLDPQDLTYKAATISIKDYHPKLISLSFPAFINKILPLNNGHGRVLSPVLTFDAVHPLIDYSKRALMRALEAACVMVPLVRAALHPTDPLDHIIKRIRALLRHRRPVTYSELLS